MRSIGAALEPPCIAATLVSAAQSNREVNMRQNIRVAAILVWTAAYCPAARLTQPAERAFDAYITNLESRLAEQHTTAETYLAALGIDAPARTDREQQLRAGAVRIEPVNGGSWAIS